MARADVTPGATNAVAMQQRRPGNPWVLCGFALQDSEADVDDASARGILRRATLDAIEQQMRCLVTDTITINFHRRQGWVGVGSEAQVAKSHHRQRIGHLEPARG